MTGHRLVDMRGVDKRFGGVHAVRRVSLHIQQGEVLGILGHNGAGKSVLMNVLSGVYPATAGEIYVGGHRARLSSPRDAKRLGIETIYQTLALADNLDAVANLFLGRELRTPWRTMDHRRMHREARDVLHRINPRLTALDEPVSRLSGGQRQSIAIARAVYFDARILIMDEPTAALGIHETRQVGELIRTLKDEGLGIFLISHDLNDVFDPPAVAQDDQAIGEVEHVVEIVADEEDAESLVFDLADRLIILSNGRRVGSCRVADVTRDDVMEMIVLGDGYEGRHRDAGDGTTKEKPV